MKHLSVLVTIYQVIASPKKPNKAENTEQIAKITQKPDKTSVKLEKPKIKAGFMLNHTSIFKKTTDSIVINSTGHLIVE